MSIIPTLRCRRVRASVTFYTRVLDFQLVDGDGGMDDPAFVVLTRGSDQLILSSHAGDGAFGQAVVVTTSDVDTDFKRFLSRGLRPPPAAAGSPVHASPLDQTWGTREVYINDPDGHTLRFVQGWDTQDPPAARAGIE